MVLDARDEHQTDQEIADFLGVSRSWVKDVRLSMEEGDKFGANTKFATQSSKREQAEEYLQENPEASNREVASETPVSRTTAGKIKKELEEESQSDSKASDTGTQTDKGGSEGNESFYLYTLSSGHRYILLTCQCLSSRGNIITGFGYGLSRK